MAAKKLKKTRKENGDIESLFYVVIIRILLFAILAFFAAHPKNSGFGLVDALRSQPAFRVEGRHAAGSR